MDVTHPGSKPLDSDQYSLLDAVRGEVATLMQGQRFSFDFD